MIKKIIASLLLALLLFSTACGNILPAPPHVEVVLPVVEIPRDIIPGAEDEVEVIFISNDTYAAFNAYMGISTKLDHKLFEANLVNQFEMDFTMEFDMYVDWMSFSSGEMTGNLKMIIDGDNIEYAMLMDMGSMGMGTMEIYFDGNEGYYNIDGELIPMEFDEVMGTLDNTVNLPEFTEQAIKSAEIFQVGENTQYIIVIDGQYLSDFVMASMADQFEEIGSDLDFVFEDVEIIMLNAPDGKPINFSMFMQMTMEYEGIETAMRMKAFYEIIEWGIGVNIEIPSA